jgi:hypothetical protein
MNEATDFRIGSEVSCSDGACGVLARVVIDPVARALTHLVVEPGRGKEGGRLVPVDLVASTAEGVKLSCSTVEFGQLEEAEETQFLPGGDGQWGYAQDQMLSRPYYGFGGPALGMSGIGIGNSMPGPQAVTNDRVPMGEVEVRRGDRVHATDGAIGRVQGLVVHPGDHCVTHVLLDEGHLWGQKKVAIPISAVKDVEDGVRLTLSKDEVRDLPEVGLLGTNAGDGQK